MVFVVFGILGVNRTQRADNHVIGDMVRAPPGEGGGYTCRPGSPTSVPFPF